MSPPPIKSIPSFPPPCQPGQAAAAWQGREQAKPSADGPNQGPSLLYQYSNNTAPQAASDLAVLTPYHLKQLYILKTNTQKFITEIGIERVGFLTLTFPDNVIDHREAYRRFGNMRKQFLDRFYAWWMLVKERQLRGAWHYHILIDCKGDIRTGVDHDAIRGDGRKRADYRTAPKLLRNLWRINREMLPRYGFGRSELLPLRKAEDAVACYMSKYMSKHLEGRAEEDKGVRLVSYCRDFVRSNCNFAFNSDGGREFRRKLAKFAQIMGHDDFKDLSAHYGPRWAYHLFQFIYDVDEYTREQMAVLKKALLRGHGDHVTELPLHGIIEGNLYDLGTGEQLF